MKKNINENKALSQTSVSGSIETFTYLKTVEKDMVTLVRRVNITNSEIKEVVRYKKYMRKVFPQYFTFAEMSNEKLDCIYDV
jgi:hypothetical protein